MPSDFLRRTLRKNHNSLVPSYLAVHRASREGALDAPKLKKTKTAKDIRYGDDKIEATIQAAECDDHKEALEELRIARAMLESERATAAAERRLVEEEESNLVLSQIEGAIIECGCCFDELPLNRMVHCDGDVVHHFCRACAKKHVETAIGMSKYEFACMSMDGCAATFSRSQQSIFLDPKSIAVLDRLEQDAMLRLAGLDNLESCPFCFYAAVYPPVEENKEFNCENPECSVTSCRLCRKETHIPKTCEEMQQEEGEGARRTVEEAMSAALIRKCNKCESP